MTQDIAYQIANIAALAADDRKAVDIVILSVADLTVLTDYFVIATGFSKNQLRAIAKHIQEQVAEKCDRAPLRVSGEMEGTWIVQDFGEVIVHIMQPREREFYALESFWGHAPRLLLTKNAS
ncbi:MAG: ribosome silencing factor [Pseudanabaenaceae cyanobacterium]